MKRKFIVLIFVVFSFAAIGLLLIQRYQTKRSMAVSDSLFNISVTNAMDAVVPQLEQVPVEDYSFSRIDSIITEELLVNGISTSPQVAITYSNLQEFLYCSRPGSESDFLQSPYKFSYHPSFGSGDMELYMILYFPRSPWDIQYDSKFFSIISFLLLIVVGVLLFITTYTISKQRKVDEMKNDFINNMTHEIKTPLATISLASQMLRDPTVSTDEEQKANFLNIIKDESDRLRVLVESILQSAKMANKNYSITLDEVDMHDVIAKGCSSFELTLKSRNGNLTTDLKADPHVIYADPLHMYNLVHNLIDNAIKYSPETPEIAISTDIVNNQFQLQVQDHGIGISKEDQRHIFEKFYRVSTGNVHNVKGFGIGLNYVAQVVQLHKGTISVASEPGQGSTFTILLPLI